MFEAAVGEGLGSDVIARRRSDQAMRGCEVKTSQVPAGKEVGEVARRDPELPIDDPHGELRSSGCNSDDLAPAPMSSRTYDARSRSAGRSSGSSSSTS